MDGAIKSRTDIKIFILYLLSEINYPLDYSTLCEIVAENGFIGSFDFAESFQELRELGHIEELCENGVKTYTVTATGRMVAAELQDHLLESIRKRSSLTAARILSLSMRGAKASATVTPRDDGHYSVVCAIDEPKGKLLSVELTIASRTEADRIKAFFEEKPENIYRGILSVMTGEIDYLLS